MNTQTQTQETPIIAGYSVSAETGAYLDAIKALNVAKEAIYKAFETTYADADELYCEIPFNVVEEKIREHLYNSVTTYIDTDKQVI